MSAGPAAQSGQLASRRIYAGRVVQLDIDTVRFPDGSTAEMELFRHPGAAAVVPVLTAGSDPDILLIHQYRYAAGGEIWEVPAGRLDPGEAPEACARRELLEETGARAEHVERLTTIFPTPGYCDEQIHLFAAHGLRIDAGAIRRESDEFMHTAALPLSRVLGLIERGELRDAKTICAVLYFAAFRGSV